MKFAIDSNRYTDFCRGEDSVVELFESAEILFVPLIVLAEQRAGFAMGRQREKNENILSRFLSVEGVELLVPDDQTTHFYAEIYQDLRKRGKPLPTNDLWIAALCIQHSLPLYTRDRDFEAILRLARL